MRASCEVGLCHRIEHIHLWENWRRIQRKVEPLTGLGAVSAECQPVNIHVCQLHGLQLPFCFCWQSCQILPVIFLIQKNTRRILGYVFHGSQVYTLQSYHRGQIGMQLRCEKMRGCLLTDPGFRSGTLVHSPGQARIPHIVKMVFFLPITGLSICEIKNI